MPPIPTRPQALVASAPRSTAPLTFAQVDPPALGSRDVRIEIAAVTLGFADLTLTEGKFPGHARFPLVPGFEIAGTIIATGADVTRARIGDRVFAYLGGGGVATHVTAAEHRIFAMPPEMTFETGAMLPASYGVAAIGLLHRCALTPDDTVLVRGASGAVGFAAVEIARAIGAATIALCGTPEKCEPLAARGAEALSPAAYLSGAEARQRKPTVMIDPVGEPGFAELAATLEWGARIQTIGFAGGGVPALPLSDVLRRGLSVFGVPWGQTLDRRPQECDAALRQVVEWWREGRIDPPIAETYPFKRARDALDSLEGERRIGRVIVKIGG